MSRLCARVVVCFGLLVLGPAHAEGYYVCQDPKTGKKVGQDFPCQGKEIGNYAPVDARERKAREEAARQSKREFERQHPGTYKPEEYLTDEELAVYRVEEKKRLEEKRKVEEQQAIQDALRRSERAEQRALEAERAAREAKEKAAEAEAAAASRRVYPMYPPAPPRPPGQRIGNCDGTGCWDDQGRRYNRGGAGVFIGPSGPCRQEGNTLRCP